jgi:Xaa-Pro aminopeptidase
MTLTPMAVAARADRVRARTVNAALDAFVITNLRNIRYLTGFTGSAAIAVLTADALVVVTDGRYGDQAAAQLATAGVAASVEVGRTVTAQREFLGRYLAGVARIGLEADEVSWSDQRVYASTVFADAELVATSGIVEAERAVKDDGEVARIERAASIADAALIEVLRRFGDGVTEHEVATELEHQMRRLGADGPSFATIIAAGENSALPHHRPTIRPLHEGDLVVCDFGALIDGYASDMTRTFLLGDGTAEQRRLLEVVRAAQAAGVAAVAPGVKAAEVDAACRSVIAEAGWADRFTHGTGHGVGLDIHEAPPVGATSTAVLASGNVVTVEPGVYLSGLGGVRVEDSLLVTASGCRVLTHHPKDPKCLPSRPMT